MGAGCLTLARSLTLTLPSRERSQPYGSRRRGISRNTGRAGAVAALVRRAAGKRLLGGGAQSAVSECPPHPRPAPAPPRHTQTASNFL